MLHHRGHRSPERVEGEVTTIPSPNDLYHSAQVLARKGQPVFPCSSSLDIHGKAAKAPLTRNGYKDASTDPAQIKRWWTRYRGAAIGTPTGLLWDVLDADLAKNDDTDDGRVHLPYLHRVGLLNGCKRVVKTPSGGWHLYFKSAPALGFGIGSNAYIGLDIRAVGGYVLAPGSYIDTRPDGKNYAGLYADEGSTVDSTDEPLLWDLVTDAIRPVNADTKTPIVLLEAEQAANVGGLKIWLSNKQMVGERNKCLHWATMRCIDAGIDPHELVEVALFIGLGEAETKTTIEKAMQRAGLKPSDLKTEVEIQFPDAQSA